MFKGVMVKKRSKDKREAISEYRDASETEAIEKPKTNKVIEKKPPHITNFQTILTKTKGNILSSTSDVFNDFDPNGSASSDMFFELANAKAIQDGEIVICQDVNADLDHSGGIIWETSYLLYQYLVHNTRHWERRKEEKTQILEIGAGCGYLGCSLGKKYKEVEVCFIIN